VEAADTIVAFRTCPHVDQRDTGRRAARVLANWLAGGPRPAMAHVKIPMVAPASTHVDFLDGPFRRLMAFACAAEQRGALTASLFTVQPWLDIAEFGFASLVVTEGDVRLARW